MAVQEKWRVRLRVGIFWGEAKMEEQIDQRKYLRFKVRDGSTASLINNTSSKLGIISDISGGGLAFYYLNGNLEQEKDVNKPFELNIYHAADGFYLINVPCTIIEDNFVLLKCSFCLDLVKQCRVQFGELTSDQISQLEYFIENLTEDSTKRLSSISIN